MNLPPTTPPLRSWVIWTVCFSLAAVCGFVVVRGIWRDRRIGEPVMTVDVSRAGAESRSFRVWRGGAYRLFISAVNWDSTHAGVPLDAELTLSVTGPGVSRVFERRYAPGETQLQLPINYADALLAELAIDGSLRERHTVAVQVHRGDPRWGSARTEVKLYRDRPDVGMGGLVNYVLIFPGLIFLGLAFVSAIPLARAGAWWPLAACVVLTLGVIVLLRAG